MYNSSKADSKIQLISNVKEQFDIINFNNACHTPILSVPFTAAINWHTYFAVCDGRGSNILEENNDYLIEETKTSIKHMLGIDQDSEVIFTYNATAGLQLASELIFNYIDQNQEYDNADKNVFIHPLAHNSLRYPVCKYANDKDINLEPYCNLNKYFKNNQVNVVALPYIDNLIGLNHWSEHLATVKVNKIYKENSTRTVKEKFGWRPSHTATSGSEIPLYTILDACQAMTEIMFESNQGAKSKQFSKADAIVFSGHKMYSHHLGIVIIKKKFLHKNIKLNHKNLSVGGGSIERYENEQPIFKPNQANTIQGGLKDNSAIFALGALLDSIHTYSYKYKAHQKRKKNLIYGFIEDIFRLAPILTLTKTNLEHLPSNSIVSISTKYFPIQDLYSYLGSLDQSLIGGGNIKKTSFMTRTGDCCVHYGCQKYNINNSLRFSFSIANTRQETKDCIAQIKAFLTYYDLFDLENDTVKVPQKQV